MIRLDSSAFRLNSDIRASGVVEVSKFGGAEFECANGG
jgi:hypothetical protein